MPHVSNISIPLGSDSGSTFANSPLGNIDRESRLAMNCPGRRIVVSIFPPTSFLVHIRIIRAYAFI